MTDPILEMSIGQSFLKNNPCFRLCPKIKNLPFSRKRKTCFFPRGSLLGRRDLLTAFMAASMKGLTVTVYR
jgi:hypothetical protein